VWHDRGQHGRPSRRAQLAELWASRRPEGPPPDREDAVIVVVDVAGGPATLAEPEDCKRFHVEAAGGDLDAVAGALGPAGTAEGAPEGHVYVDVDWVRRQAAGRVPDGWDADFEGMLGYARSKGWLNEAGTAIQAHVEWA
jgi:hypothetical protein